MEKGISLCLVYPRYDDNTKKTLYRLADYRNEKFTPVYEDDFSPYYHNFSPRFLRFPPEYDPELYSIVVRSWEMVPKNDDYEKCNTNSYPYYDVEPYEVVFDLSHLEGDTSKIQEAMKNGITLPDGRAENILFVINETKKEYVTLFCKKRWFRKFGNLYYLNNQISDMVHTRHYLVQYSIYKSDVFDTSEIGIFAKNDERYFYKYSNLPKSDDYFYLYEIEDYIPFFVSRFIKMNNTEEFSKNEIQRIEKEVLTALKSEQDINLFFANTGYNSYSVLSALEDSQECVTRYFSGSDEINTQIKAAMLKDENIKQQLFNEAKELWLAETDIERDEIEKELFSIEREVDRQRSSVDKLKEKETYLKELLLKMEEEKEVLNADKNRILNELNESIKNIDQEIGTQIKNYLYYKNMNGSPKDRGVVESKKSFDYHTSIVVEEDAKELLDLETAIKYMSRNLSKSGMKKIYADIVANILFTQSGKNQTVIIDGYYARAFAAAISYSVEASEPMTITLNESNANYKELYEIINSSDRTVFLLENILDTCNELILMNLNKDFNDKIFVFSIENEEMFKVLPKSIWKYSYMINTDMLYEEIFKDQNYKAAKVSEPLMRAAHSDDDCEEYENIISLFNLPFVAQNHIYRSYNMILEELGEDAANDYVYSIIVAFAQLYKNEYDADDWAEYQALLPEDLLEKYKL